jgi:hypothetical protein
MLVHLLSLAKRKQPLNLRVDLRLRNKAGFPIYDREQEDRPLYGLLTHVEVKRPPGSKRKYLMWRYTPERGVKVPSATPGFARVVLGPTSGNYFLLVAGEAPCDESPSGP